FEAGHGNAANSCLICANENSARAGHDPQQVENKTRHDLVPDPHHDRHAPDDPVTLRADAEPSASRCCPLQLGKISQQMPEGEERSGSANTTSNAIAALSI